ncbi:putative cytochrome P450 family protein [Aspergillus floccosus]
MSSVPLFTALLTACMGVVRLVLHLWEWKQLNDKFGCEMPPMCPSKDPLGICDLLELLQADKQGHVLKTLEHRLERTRSQEGRNVSTFCIRQIGQVNGFTCDPMNVKATLATGFRDFDIGMARVGDLSPLLGTEFVSEREDWAHARALLRPLFNPEYTTNLGMDERHVQNAMRTLPVVSDNWTAPVNIQALFLNLTMDTATEFLFGESVQSQLASVEESASVEERTPSNDFAYHFDRAQWYCAGRIGLEKLYWILGGGDFRNSCHRVHAFVDRTVHSAQQKQRQGKDGNSLLLAIAEMCDDPAKLRSHLLDLLFAARDTTASLLGWAKLRHAIFTEIGSYKELQKITPTALQHCKYLQYFLKEVLRLYPPVPLDHRCAVRDTLLPRGGGRDGTSPVLVRKGQNVMCHPHVLHRQTEIWGEDAASFDPRRWADHRPDWGYLPFNGGPRKCIGQHQAIIQASYVLVRLVQRFDKIEDVRNEKEIKSTMTLVSEPAGGATVWY